MQTVISEFHAPRVSSRARLCYPVLLLTLATSCQRGAVAATPDTMVPDDAEPARLYRTREEQRETGLARQITPWLTASGLAELEALGEDYDATQGSADASASESSATVQLGLTATPGNSLRAELILEYETDTDKAITDEALLAVQAGDWEIALGRLYVPFGVYFSNFVSDPLLQFGETQAREAALATWAPGDNLELSLALYRGRARRQGSNPDQPDWSLATQFWFNHAWSFGLSYQSDLADADSRLLQDENDRYEKRVSGVSGYLLWVGERFEATLEALAATGSLRELDRDRNRPLAWNSEIVWFIADSPFELAFRVEGSRELEDAPRYQFGPALTWRAGKSTSLTLEYLHGEFDGELATSEEDQPYDDVDRIGVMLSVAF